MEGCLKKLVLEAGPTDFQDLDARSEPPESKTALEGLSWRLMGVYSRAGRAQKEIPGETWQKFLYLEIIQRKGKVWLWY